MKKVKAIFKQNGGFPEYILRIGKVDLIIPDIKAHHINFGGKSFGSASEMEVRFNDPHIGEKVFFASIGKEVSDNYLEILKCNFKYKYNNG